MQPYFNVDSTLLPDVETTLFQRWNARCKHLYMMAIQSCIYNLMYLFLSFLFCPFVCLYSYLSVHLSSVCLSDFDISIKINKNQFVYIRFLCSSAIVDHTLDYWLLEPCRSSTRPTTFYTFTFWQWIYVNTTPASRFLRLASPGRIPMATSVVSGRLLGASILRKWGTQ